METWNPALDSGGLYEVSTLGNVRNVVTGSRVSPYWQGKYRAFTIHSAGRRRVVSLHVAVLSAFRGERPAGKVAAHLDGDADNCRLDNLAWVTPAENEAHKLLHGTDARGEKSAQAKFSNADADLIRKAYVLGMTMAELGRLTKVNQSTIHKIVLGKRYNHS